MELSNIDSSKKEIYKSDFCLNSFILDIVDNYQIIAKEKNIVLNFEPQLSEYESIIISDQIKIGQILNNLLVNAITFTKKGAINLGYKIIDNKIEFKVQDTGIGISEDNISKI